MPEKTSPADDNGKEENDSDSMPEFLVPHSTPESAHLLSPTESEPTFAFAWLGIDSGVAPTEGSVQGHSPCLRAEDEVKRGGSLGQQPPGWKLEGSQGAPLFCSRHHSPIQKEAIPIPSPATVLTPSDVMPDP